MSFTMVWANFTNPSLHLLEQPLMVVQGECRLCCQHPEEMVSTLSAPGTWRPPRRTLRDGRTPEAPGTAQLPLQRVRLLHPGSLQGTASAPFLRPSPPPLPAVHSSPTHRKTSGCQGWDGTAGSQGAVEHRGGERSSAEQGGSSWISPRLR